jgi:hypothetical protein
MRECQIIFTYQDASGDFHIESLRASKAGTCFRIEGIPLFTPSISKGDIVCASEQDEHLHYDMTLDLSGNSTIQVSFNNEEDIAPALEELEKLGCSWEVSADRRLLGIDIPADVQYSLVQHFLERGEEESKWSYKESALAHY